MKYKGRKTMCARGCGRERRSSGRYCNECHAAAMRDARRIIAVKGPEEKVRRLVTATVRGRRGMTPEMREKIEALAKKVARQIEELNGGRG